MDFNLKISVLETYASQDEIIDYGLYMMNVPDMWTFSKGEGVGVAIIDTGIDAGHPDLNGNIKMSIDFTGSPVNGMDKVGHGTHVAGIIAGIDNGTGVIGVAPRCNIYSLKALSDGGQGRYEWIISALQWVLNNHMAYNIKVVNMSLGCQTPFPQDAILLKALRDAGVIVVCAAGNDGDDAKGDESTVDFPAKYAAKGLCISVGAIDNLKHLAAFSSNGKGEITVVGPGVNVLSCYPVNKYAKLSGTSMASPAIAGLLALMIGSHQKRAAEGNPSATPLTNLDQAIEHLKEVSKEIGPENKFGFGFPRLTENT